MVGSCLEGSRWFMYGGSCCMAGLCFIMLLAGQCCIVYAMGKMK